MSISEASVLAGIGWPLPDHGLSVAEKTLAFAGCVVFYTLIYMYGRTFFPKGSTRQKAWILTTISSTGTSILGTIYAALFQQYGSSLFYRTDDLSQLGVIFFITYLVLDLTFGYFEYPDQMNVLSGYVHHIVYIGLLTWIWQHDLLVTFMLFLPCEIPTAIMCYGQLNRKWRRDWTFGITFFVLRVAYMAWMTIVVYQAGINFWIAAFLILGLHVYWFYCWIVSQRRKGVIKDFEDRYAHQINRLKTHRDAARNFVKRTVTMKKRVE